MDQELFFLSRFFDKESKIIDEFKILTRSITFSGISNSLFHLLLYLTSISLVFEYSQFFLLISGKDFATFLQIFHLIYCQ